MLVGLTNDNHPVIIQLLFHIFGCPTNLFLCQLHIAFLNFYWLLNGYVEVTTIPLGADSSSTQLLPHAVSYAHARKPSSVGNFCHVNYAEFPIKLCQKFPGKYKWSNTSKARSSFRRFKIDDFATNPSVCQPFFF